MTVKAIIFDKDGTLFDFQATWGVWTGNVIRHFAQGDHSLATKIAAAVHYDLTQEKVGEGSIIVAGTPFEIAETIAPVIDQPDVRSVFDELNRMAAVAPQEEVTDLPAFFKGLKSRGIKVAVMTNDAEAPAKAHLEAAGCLGVLDLVVGSDSGHGAKPDAGPILAIMRILDVPPEACVMVGDSLHDLHAGRAAGATPIAVLTGLATKETLAPHADAVLPSIRDLPNWLDQSDR